MRKSVGAEDGRNEAGVRVSRIVTGITTATTMLSRQPIATSVSTMIDSVARNSFRSSVSAFSLAVSP